MDKQTVMLFNGRLNKKYIKPLSAEEMKTAGYDEVELKEYQEVELKPLGLEAMQLMVDGYIEDVPMDSFNNKGIRVICNEEGKLRYLKPSFVIEDFGRLLDVVCGNVLFVGDGDETYVGLTLEQIGYITTIFSLSGKFKMNGKYIPALYYSTEEYEELMEEEENARL